jgi:hypothetical protein
MRFHRLQTTLAAVVVTLALVGCGDSGPDNSPIKIKGADKVLTAIQKNDCEAMIAGLAEVKEVAGNNPDAKAEYRRLREKVADYLVPRMGDDEKAKEAYRALSALETGR